MTNEPLPPALEVARLVGGGDSSAVAVARAALDRAARTDAELRAFTELWPDRALEIAREVDERLASGERLALAGVPIGLKSPGSRQGVQVRRLIAAGCVPIGVTAVPAKATPWQTWGQTDRGSTANPWRPDRSPGGSSAGSSAAVAAGIVPMATAVDGAGSTRIPAAWCGVVGLKPTNGLIPTTDPTGLSVGGPIARTVADAAAYLDAVAGTALLAVVREPTALDPVSATWSANLGFADTDPEVAEVAHKAVARMTRAGLVALVDVPLTLLDPQSTWLSLRSGRGGGAYRELNRDELRRLFAQLDVLITPTTPNRPHGHDGPGETMSTALTWAFNLSGHPAISVPAGFTADGCPVGVQFIARHGDEATLIRLAAAWERLVPWPFPDLP
ncbi:MAG TPA: amidase [Mycobacteriales bacterium]|nr:amidase [Mycobacteriales bacterium]